MPTIRLTVCLSCSQFKVICDAFANVLPQDANVSVDSILSSIREVITSTGATHMLAAKAAARHQLMTELSAIDKKDMFRIAGAKVKDFAGVWQWLTAPAEP